MDACILVTVQGADTVMCRCGDSFDSSFGSNMGNCDTPCPSATDQLCGGSEFALVLREHGSDRVMQSLFSRYLSWYRIKRAVVWIQRFIIVIEIKEESRSSYDYSSRAVC